MKKCLWAVALLVLGASMASADLVMKIDAAAKNFYFEGSDSGIGQDVGGPFELSFSTGNNYNLSSDPPPLQIGSCFEESFELLNVLNLSIGTKLQIYLLGFDTTTLTGKGSSFAVSYASLSSANQTVFESMVGDAFSLDGGSGYSDISVQAVPEPATAGLLGISAGALWLIRRLKKAANYYRT